jgi:hypothetical protein
MSGRHRTLAALLAAGLLVLALTGAALAASPEPTVAPGGDPRSAGEGPGLVGEPGLAIAAVLVIGVVVAGATTLFVRLTRRTDDASRRS